MQPARQRRQQRIERPAVAAEKTAYERGARRTVVPEEDGVGKAGGGGGVHLRPEAQTSPARHHVGVAVGKHDHVARHQLDRLLAAHAPVSSGRGQDVVGDQVLGGGQDPGGELPGRRRARRSRASTASTAKKYAPSRRTTRRTSERGSIAQSEYSASLEPPHRLEHAQGQAWTPDPIRELERCG